MTCRKCKGLMIVEYWHLDGSRGIDWRCLNCGSRLPLKYHDGYGALPPAPVKGQRA